MYYRKIKVLFVLSNSDTLLEMEGIMMSKKLVLTMVLSACLVSLVIVASVLSQSAKTEREVPEPFECSTLAHVSISKEHSDKFKLNMKKLGNQYVRIFHCRAGSLDCAYMQGESISCVKSNLLEVFK